jgi:alkaline phosphatase
VTSATDLKKVAAAKTDKLLGIFSFSHMNVWIDRNLFPENAKKNGPDQPGLLDQCKIAIDILSKNNKGFFLMVEGSDIDKQEHSMSWERAVADTIEFDNVIGYVQDWAAKNGNNTLIAVTADHAHTFDVYGTIDLAAYDKLADKMKAAAAATPAATLSATTDATAPAATLPSTKSASAPGATLSATAAATKPAAPARAFPANDIRLNAIGVYQNAGIPDYKPGKDNFPESWDVKYPLVIGWGNHPAYTDNFRLDKTPQDAAVVPAGGEAVPNPQRDNDGIYFTANLPLDSGQEVHTLQDVPLNAMGPGSECFNGWHDNTDVFFCLAGALGFDPRQFPAPAAPATAPATVPATKSAAVLPVALLMGTVLLGGVTRRKQF